MAFVFLRMAINDQCSGPDPEAATAVFWPLLLIKGQNSRLLAPQESCPTVRSTHERLFLSPLALVCWHRGFLPGLALQGARGPGRKGQVDQEAVLD